MRFGVIILAAGQSRRMGDAHKLLAELGGKAMIRHVAEMAAALEAKATLIITGREGDAVAAEVAGLPIRRVHNPDFANGLSTSLKVGIAALPDGVDAALILLGDMPLITPDHCRILLAAAAKHEGDVVRGGHLGQMGNPVVLPSALFQPINALMGDQGAQGLVKALGLKMHLIELGEAAMLDADTPEALAALRQLF